MCSAGLDGDGACAKLGRGAGEIRSAAEHRHVVRLRSTARLRRAEAAAEWRDDPRNGGRSGTMKARKWSATVVAGDWIMQDVVGQLTCSTLQR